MYKGRSRSQTLSVRMPDSPTSEPESAFVCDCHEWMRKACVGEPFYRELKGKRYCLLHFPGKEKSADFEQALQRKLENEDFDFRGVWFPDKLPFEHFEFRTKANFVSATFSAKADFSSATFGAAADFRFATFNALVYFGTPADLDVLDLRKAVNRLINFIRSANDFGES
jgi:hypothetical protein